MNLYIKPSAMFITASGTGVGVACSTSDDDLALLEDILGITDWNNAFAATEDCKDRYVIEEYCKFTSVENGSAVKILTS